MKFVSANSSRIGDEDRNSKKLIRIGFLVNCVLHLLNSKVVKTHRNSSQLCFKDRIVTRAALHQPHKQALLIYCRLQSDEKSPNSGMVLLHALVSGLEKK